MQLGGWHRSAPERVTAIIFILFPINTYMDISKEKKRFFKENYLLVYLWITTFQLWSLKSVSTLLCLLHEFRGRFCLLVHKLQELHKFVCRAFMLPSALKVMDNKSSLNPWKLLQWLGMCIFRFSVFGAAS